MSLLVVLVLLMLPQSLLESSSSSLASAPGRSAGVQRHRWRALRLVKVGFRVKVVHQQPWHAIRHALVNPEP